MCGHQKWEIDLEMYEIRNVKVAPAYDLQRFAIAVDDALFMVYKKSHPKSATTI